MSSNGLQPVEVEKDLGIMITSHLKCSQQCDCEYAYSKANRVMGMIRRTITYKEPKIMQLADRASPASKLAHLTSSGEILRNTRR